MFVLKLKVLVNIQSKVSLAILFFNKFLAEIVQEDLLNSNHLKNVLTFLIYFTNFIEDNDFYDLLFKFLFGFGQMFDISKRKCSNNDYGANTISAFSAEEQSEKSLKSDHLNTFNSEMSTVMVVTTEFKPLTYEEKINRNEHYVEEIISTITKIFESTTAIELKARLVIILNNLMKKSYNLFLKELINPFYCYLLFNTFKKDFKDKLKEYESVSVYNVSVDDFKGMIVPRYFSLVLDINQDKKYLAEDENYYYFTYLSTIAVNINNNEGEDLNLHDPREKLLNNYDNDNENMKNQMKNNYSTLNLITINDKVDCMNTSNKPATKELYTNIIQNIRVIL